MENFMVVKRKSSESKEFWLIKDKFPPKQTMALAMAL
jgi:hypothetical protein